MSPFKGVTSHEVRPWKETGLTTELWMSEVATKFVRMKDLWLLQDGVFIRGLFGEDSFSIDPFPHVVICNGEMYLEDGHHRVVKLALAGDLYLEARVYNLDEKRN